MRPTGKSRQHFLGLGQTPVDFDFPEVQWDNSFQSRRGLRAHGRVVREAREAADGHHGFGPRRRVDAFPRRPPV
jgi:hypothetical protein